MDGGVFDPCKQRLGTNEKQSKQPLGWVVKEYMIYLLPERQLIAGSCILRSVLPNMSAIKSTKFSIQYKVITETVNDLDSGRKNNNMRLRDRYMAIWSFQWLLIT